MKLKTPNLFKPLIAGISIQLQMPNNISKSMFKPLIAGISIFNVSLDDPVAAAFKPLIAGISMQASAQL